MNRPLEHMYAINAGLEPEGFIELFPYWVVQEDITEIQIDVRRTNRFFAYCRQSMMVAFSFSIKL